MHANVRIGDRIINISERSATRDDFVHVIVVHDNFLNVKLESIVHALKIAHPSFAEVKDETEAIKVLEAFLNLDGPDAAFRNLFPEHSS